MRPAKPNMILHSLLICLTVYFLGNGCSTTVIDNDSPPEAQYAEGERLLKKDRYIESVERFRILKSRYPYSKYAALASLKIGDAHFQQDAFIEAATAYKIFRELYPKHEQAGYALFRIGECHYNLMPRTSDRDLEPAESAIAAYRQFLREYPNSKEQPEAEKKIKELLGKLAEKEDYIANFYFIREQYLAAAGRYQELLDSYPDLGYEPKALYRLAFSFERLGDFQKAESAIRELEKNYPDKSETKNAQKLRKKLEKEQGISQ